MVSVFTKLNVKPLLHLTSDQAPDIVAEKGGCLALFVESMNKIQANDPNIICKEGMEIIKVYANNYYY